MKRVETVAIVVGVLCLFLGLGLSWLANTYWPSQQAEEEVLRDSTVIKAMRVVKSGLPLQLEDRHGNKYHVNWWASDFQWHIAKPGDIVITRVYCYRGFNDESNVGVEIIKYLKQ